jgi:diaminopimelate decarboxylase
MNISQFHTPYFYYDLDQVVHNINAYKSLTNSNVRILYATMANARPEILRSIKRCGIGVFVNSLSHLRNSLEAGIDPKDIVFAGSGHEDELIKNIGSIGVNYHADSLEQLKTYIKHNPTRKVGLRVNVGSLLRNYDLDPAPRLGMTLEEIDKSIKTYPLNTSTLHVYVGTNLLDAEMHCKSLKALFNLAQKYECISDIDLGGGFAFAPGDSHDHGMWSTVMGLWHALSQNDSKLQLTIEPGRSIVRTAGQFIIKVTDIKKRNGDVFAMVNTSGTWFPRKIIHDSDEDNVSIVGREKLEGSIKTYICGSTTFSKDFLSVCMLPKISVGDVICFNTAGAYNEAMHIDFLGMPEPGVVVRENDNLAIVRETERPNF